MAKKNTKNIMEGLRDTGFGIAGAYGGVKITDAIQIGLEKGNTKNAARKAPAITGIIGVLGQVFAPPMVKPAMLGVAIAGGTELLLGLEMKKTTAPSYQTDADGNFVLDAEGNKILSGGQTRVSAYNSMQGDQTRVSAYDSVQGHIYRKY